MAGPVIEARFDSVARTTVKLKSEEEMRLVSCGRMLRVNTGSEVIVEVTELSAVLCSRAP